MQKKTAPFVHPIRNHMPQLASKSHTLSTGSSSGAEEGQGQQAEEGQGHRDNGDNRNQMASSDTKENTGLSVLVGNNLVNNQELAKNDNVFSGSMAEWSTNQSEPMAVTPNLGVGMLERLPSYSEAMAAKALTEGHSTLAPSTGNMLPTFGDGLPNKSILQTLSPTDLLQNSASPPEAKSNPLIFLSEASQSSRLSVETDMPNFLQGGNICADSPPDLLATVTKQFSKSGVVDILPPVLAMTPKGTGAGYGVGSDLEYQLGLGYSRSER